MFLTTISLSKRAAMCALREAAMDPPTLATAAAWPVAAQAAAENSYPHGFPFGVHYVAVRRLSRSAMAQNLPKHIEHNMLESTL